MDTLNDTVDIPPISITPDTDYAKIIRGYIDRVESSGDEFEALQPKLANHRPQLLLELSEKSRDLTQKNEEMYRKCDQLKLQIEEQTALIADRKATLKISNDDNADLKKSIQDRHDTIIAKYKFLLNKLDLTMRVKFQEDHWDIEFTHHGNIMTLGYDSELDTFELNDMKPMVTTFGQLKELLNRTNDVEGLLCAWVLNGPKSSSEISK